MKKEHMNKTKKSIMKNNVYINKNDIFKIQ